MYFICVSQDAKLKKKYKQRQHNRKTGAKGREKLTLRGFVSSYQSALVMQIAHALIG